MFGSHVIALSQGWAGCLAETARDPKQEEGINLHEVAAGSYAGKLQRRRLLHGEQRQHS